MLTMMRKLLEQEWHKIPGLTEWYAALDEQLANFKSQKQGDLSSAVSKLKKLKGVKTSRDFRSSTQGKTQQDSIMQESRQDIASNFERGLSPPVMAPRNLTPLSTNPRNMDIMFLSQQQF
jgi:hypothetical protein